MFEYKFGYEIRKAENKKFGDIDLIMYLFPTLTQTEYPLSSHKLEEREVYYFSSESPLKDAHKQFLIEHGFEINEK